MSYHKRWHRVLWHKSTVQGDQGCILTLFEVKDSAAPFVAVFSSSLGIQQHDELKADFYMFSETQQFESAIAALDWLDSVKREDVIARKMKSVTT